MFYKKVFLKILPNSQENICVGVSFFNKIDGLRPAGLLKKDSKAGVFRWISEKEEHLRVTASVLNDALNLLKVDNKYWNNFGGYNRHRSRLLFKRKWLNKCTTTKFSNYPAGIYMFNVKNRNTKTSCEICSKLTIKTPERRASFKRSSVYKFLPLTHFSPVLRFI